MIIPLSHSEMFLKIEVWKKKCVGVKICIFTNFGVTSVMHSKILIDHWGHSKMSENTNFHCKFTLNSLIKSENFHSFLLTEYLPGLNKKDFSPCLRCMIDWWVGERPSLGLAELDMHHSTWHCVQSDTGSLWPWTQLTCWPTFITFLLLLFLFHFIIKHYTYMYDIINTSISFENKLKYTL